MASDNRPTVKSNIESALQRVLDIDTHRSAIADDFVNNCKFRNERILSQVESGGVATLDYSDTEVILLNCNNNDCVATINLAGINTTTFFLIVQQKTSNFSISNATDITPNPLEVEGENYVVYRIEKYGASVTYEALIKTILNASETIRGIARMATESEVKLGNNNFTIVNPINLHKAARLSAHILTGNPGSTYNVTDKVGYIYCTALTANVKIVLPSPANSFGQQIRVSHIDFGAGFPTVYQNNGITQIVTLENHHYRIFENDGTSWYTSGQLSFYLSD